MLTSVVQRIFPMLALVFSLFGSESAVAQTVQAVAPPVVDVVDVNSVDQLTGAMRVTMPLVSIGSGGGGLSVSLSASSSQTLLDTYSGITVTNVIHKHSNSTDGQNGIRFTIMGPGIGDSLFECLDNFRFTGFGGVLNSVPQYSTTACSNGNNVPASGVATYNPLGLSDIAKSTSEVASGGEIFLDSPTVLRYVARDGTIALFELAPGSNFYIGLTARTTSIQYPSGKKIVFHYKDVNACSQFVGSNCISFINAYRVQSITSTDGYQTKLEYAQDDPNINNKDWARATTITLINNAVDYCDYVVDHCSGLTQIWPVVALSKTLSGGTESYSITDALNRTTILTYTGGSLSGIRRPSSATDNVTITYTGGRVSSVKRDGVSTSYTYTTSGIQYADDAPLINRFNTNAAGPLGHTWSTSSSWDGAQQISLNGSGQAVHAAGPGDRLTSSTDSIGRIISYNYDPNGRAIKVAAPEGNYSSYVYDARSNITCSMAVAKGVGGSPTCALPSDSTKRVSTSLYPVSCANFVLCNKPSSVTDSRGQTTDYAYDATTGFVSSITAPAPANLGPRPTDTFSYAPEFAYYKQVSGGVAAKAPTAITKLMGTSSCASAASCTGSVNELKTSISYGLQSTGIANNLLPVSTTTFSGDNSATATVGLTYDVVGNTFSTDGPLAGPGDTVRYRFDAARQLNGVVSADPDGAGLRTPVALKYSYNTDGQLALTQIGTVTDQSETAWANFVERQQTSRSFNTDGRLSRQITRSGGTNYAISDFLYDGLGRLNCTVQYMDPTLWGPQASTCAPLQTNGSRGSDRVTGINYNAADEILGIVDGVGTATARTKRSTTYTANGKPQTLKDANNNLTTYEYDSFDRLSKVRYPVPTTGGNTSSTTDYEQTNFNIIGDISSLRLRDGSSIGFTYDNLGRVITKSPQGESVTSFDLDLRSRLKAVTMGTITQNYSYDGLSRLLSESQAFGSMAYHYDLAGRVDKRTWPDGFYVNYDYDVVGEVTAIREKGAVSGSGVLATYGYDNLGRLISTTRGNGAVSTYGYDALSRLSSLGHDLAGATYDVTTNFAYTPASQLASRARSNDLYAFTSSPPTPGNYTSSGLNQYSAADTANLAYDGRGNLVSTGSATYGYTRESRLSSGPNGTSLYYDPSGRLVEYDSSVSTRFLNDGDRMSAELGNPSGAVLRRYVYGPDSDAPLVWYEGADTSDRRWLLSDERGSVVAVTNNVGGLMTYNGQPTINRYDEFGSPAANNLGRFQYTGQAYLPEIGLYHYRARAYSPSLGRFLQPDPAGYGDGMNLYAYVGNDPLNAVDHGGLQANSGNPPDIITVTAPGRQPPPFKIPGVGPSPNYGSPGSGGFASTQDFYRWTCSIGAGGCAFVNPQPVYGSSLLNGTSVCAQGCADGAAVGGVNVASWQQNGLFQNTSLTSDVFGFITSLFGSSPLEDQYVPFNQLLGSSRLVLQDRALNSNGTVTVFIPRGFIPSPAENRQGIVYRLPGSTGNANTIRIALPNNATPYPYVRYYNSGGQPISPFNGRPYSNDATHYPLLGVIGQ